MPHTELGQHALFEIIHRGFESDLAKLQSAVDDLTLANRVEKGRKLDHWFRGFAKVVRHHHRIETELFWNVLDAEIGPLPGLARVQEAFAEVDRCLDAVRKGFWSFRHVKDFVRPQAELVDLIAACRRTLSAYLRLEETELVQPFRARYSGDEFPPVDPRVARGLGLRGVAFAVPWAIGALTEDERRVLLPEVPGPLRLAYRAFHYPYQRKAAALDVWAPRSLSFAAAA
jgi:hypothetical protein